MPSMSHVDHLPRHPRTARRWPPRRSPTSSSKGIAPGGGLYVPERAARRSRSTRSSRSRQCRTGGARPTVFSRFGVDVRRRAHRRAHAGAPTASSSTTSGSRRSVEVRPDIHVLELWHGPTQRVQGHGAAVHAAVLLRSRRGQARARASSTRTTSSSSPRPATPARPRSRASPTARTPRIVVFYPADGVSDIQRKQMVTQHGDNVGVFGVRGNFDDCQSAVKAAFDDDGVQRLASRRARLAALLGQLDQLGTAAAADRLLRERLRGHGRVGRRARPASRIDVCVPTGNFGNILGAYYAQARWACRSAG